MISWGGGGSGSYKIVRYNSVSSEVAGGLVKNVLPFILRVYLKSAKE